MHDARSAICAVRERWDVPFRDVLIGRMDVLHPTYLPPHTAVERLVGGQIREWFIRPLMTLRAALLSSVCPGGIRSFLF